MYMCVCIHPNQLTDRYTDQEDPTDPTNRCDS